MCGSGVGRMLEPNPLVTQCPTGTTALNTTNGVSGGDNRGSLGTVYHYRPWDRLTVFKASWHVHK